MLTNIEFIQQSLELHLFFVRIMKEHSFFLEIGFTPKNINFIRQCDYIRREFDMFLADVISISNGVISPDVLKSGEAVTPYTLKAEMASSYFTGITIPIELTESELGLKGNDMPVYNSVLEERVCILNERGMTLTKALANLKSTILSDVISCKMFTANYPLLIDHILREAKLYYNTIQKIQNREKVNLAKEANEQEIFWNRIMAEHSKFIRGLLDPTENELINTANNFGKEFDELTKEAKEAMDQSASLSKVTEDSLKAVKEIKNFKEQGTKGLIDCKIKSIIIPLLGDHTLREANHFLRLLNIFENVINK